jgi:hypothetical protein
MFSLPALIDVLRDILPMIVLPFPDANPSITVPDCPSTNNNVVFYSGNSPASTSLPLHQFLLQAIFSPNSKRGPSNMGKEYKNGKEKKKDLRTISPKPMQK